MHDKELLKSLIEFIGRVRAEKADLPPPMLDKIHEVLLKVVDDEESEEPKAAVSPRTWTPETGTIPGLKTPEDDQHVQNLIGEGLSEREAHQALNLHRQYSHPGKNPHDGSEPSDKLLPLLRHVAGGKIKQYEERRAVESDPAKNPDIHARHKLHSAHRETHGDVHKKRQEFLNSIAHMSRFERHRAVAEFNAAQLHPEKLKEVNQTHQRAEEEALQAKQAAKEENARREKEVLGVNQIDPTRDPSQGHRSSAGASATGIAIDDLGVGREDDKPANIAIDDPDAKARGFMNANPELAAEAEQERTAQEQQQAQTPIASVMDNILKDPSMSPDKRAAVEAWIKANPDFKDKKMGDLNLLTDDQKKRAQNIKNERARRQSAKEEE